MDELCWEFHSLSVSSLCCVLHTTTVFKKADLTAQHSLDPHTSKLFAEKFTLVLFSRGGLFFKGGIRLNSSVEFTQNIPSMPTNSIHFRDSSSESCYVIR